MRHQRTKGKPVEIVHDPIAEFVDEFGMHPGAVMLAMEAGNVPLDLLKHVRAELVQSLIDEPELVPDGYRIQGAIRRLDTIIDIPSRIKELKDMPTN